MGNIRETKGIDDSLIILKDKEDQEKVNQFLDPIIQEQCDSPDIVVRQLTSSDDFIQLEEARKRMYSQRKRYYETLFDPNTYLEDVDFKSYVFAFYYKGEIVGSQRVSPYPFEISNYIDQGRLDDFLGRYHQFTTVEFSRLVVDRKSPVKGVADALGRTAGTLVTLLPRFTQYITYSRPYLKRKAFEFENKTIKFSIPERGAHEYLLFKGSLLKDLCGFYNIKDHEIPKSLNELIDREKYIKRQPAKLEVVSE